jgi:hypothetical protein
MDPFPRQGGTKLEWPTPHKVGALTGKDVGRDGPRRDVDGNAFVENFPNSFRGFKFRT